MDTMDGELRGALDEYQQQLEGLAELLRQDPDNAEALELYAQLEEAARVTQEALLAGQAEQEQQQPDAQQQGGPADVMAEAGGAGLNPSVRRGGAANNSRIHPASKYYRQEPDFASLAQRYPQLAQFVTVGPDGRAHFDYLSWAGTRELTAVLLLSDFGITWSLPEGQLVPPLTNRSNYVHWINDLLHLSAPQGAIRGLDIGCGANLIYCLLGAALYGWAMVGVDVTEVAVQCARELVVANPQLGGLLEVRDLSHLHPEHKEGAPRAKKRRRKEQNGEAAGGEGDAEGEEQHQQQQPILLPAFADEPETFAFTMCNPPFFASMKEANQNPNTAFGGSAAEMVYPGGEMAFVGQMVEDSQQLATRVHWFTTMVGKKATLKELRKELHGRGVTALRTTEFAQGKTSRWAVAWSWEVDPNKSTQPLQRVAWAEPATAPAGSGAAGAAVAADERDQLQEDQPHHEHREEQQQRSADGAVRSPATAGAGVGTGPGPGRWPEPGLGPGPGSGRVGGAVAAPASVSAPAQPLIPRHTFSFTVQAQEAQRDGRQLLQRLQSLLESQGADGVAVDAGQWTITWPMALGAGSQVQARLRLCQQQRGRFEVMATIPNKAPPPLARAFTQMMTYVRGQTAGQ